MNQTLRAPDWIRIYGWLLGALALGALCRFWDLTGPSLWLDEGWVFHISEHAPREILRLVANTDFHPPLFYLAAHYLMALHLPQWDYRYFTSGFSLIGIAATWSIARRYFGPAAGAIAAMALAVEPAVVQFDRLFRMYAILVALSILSWWLILKALDAQTETRRRWWWVAYAACAVLLPYVHYVGAFILAGQGAYALFAVRQRWPLLAGIAAAALGFIPWLGALRTQYPHGGLVGDIHAAGFSWFAIVRPVVMEGVPLSWLMHPAFDISVSIVVCGVLVAGMVVGRSTILPFWLAPIALHVIASLLTGKDLVVPRYLFVYVPAVCVAFGAVLSMVARSKLRLAAVTIALLYAGVAAISNYDMLFDQFYQFPDWYAVNVLLLQHATKTDLIVLDQGAPYWIVRDFSGFRNRQIGTPAIPSDIDWTLAWLRGYPKRRVWYIENEAYFPDPHLRVLKDLIASRPVLSAWHQARAFREDQVRIVLFGPRSRGATKRVVKTTSP